MQEQIENLVKLQAVEAERGRLIQMSRTLPAQIAEAQAALDAMQKQSAAASDALNREESLRNKLDREVEQRPRLCGQPATATAGALRLQQHDGQRDAAWYWSFPGAIGAFDHFADNLRHRSGLLELLQPERLPDYAHGRGDHK